MDQIISVILESGRSALDMALYVLLPIMVIMLALMKLLEARGVLAWIANHLAPFTRVLGIPGIGLFAMIKLLFVSFAAPMASLALMNHSRISRRYIASTLAMVMCMSQANATFPLAAYGLNLQVTLLSSLLGGLIASIVTYHLLTRHWIEEDDQELAVDSSDIETKKQSIVQILNEGGQEGVKIVFGMIPMLILAIFLVNVLKQSGAIEWMSLVLSPLLALVSLPESAVLPIVTKFIAGGTAFMGVTVDLINQGVLSATELNRMAGLVINPLDVLGVALYAGIGDRVHGIVKIALAGAACGMLVRGAVHLILF